MKSTMNIKKGFTLTEMIVVLIVLAALAAVTIPSMIGFVRHGQQYNREIIARTLYLAMQNQLSRAITEGNLRSVLTEEFYESENSDIINHPDNVFISLGSASLPFPPTDEGNEHNVFYISKPIGQHTPGGDALLDKFYALLDEVIINKDILDGAILMEFNVRTGVVMSIFYGDDLSSRMLDTIGTFRYGGGGTNDVSGGRGMEGPAAYQNAYSRRQGYYGVDSTGIPKPPRIPELVNVYDGATQDRALYIRDESVDSPFPAQRENVLYAEYILLRSVKLHT